jgi:hypothetical protein
MLQSAKTLSGGFSNYYYFITNNSYNKTSGTTAHTLSPANSFYTAKQDDVTLCGWLYNIVMKGDRRSVGGRFMLQQP